MNTWRKMAFLYAVSGFFTCTWGSDDLEKQDLNQRRATSTEPTDDMMGWSLIDLNAELHTPPSQSPRAQAESPGPPVTSPGSTDNTDSENDALLAPLGQAAAAMTASGLIPVVPPEPDPQPSYSSFPSLPNTHGAVFVDIMAHHHAPVLASEHPQPHDHGPPLSFSWLYHGGPLVLAAAALVAAVATKILPSQPN